MRVDDRYGQFLKNRKLEEENGGVRGWVGKLLLKIEATSQGNAPREGTSPTKEPWKGPRETGEGQGETPQKSKSINRDSFFFLIRRFLNRK